LEPNALTARDPFPTDAKLLLWAKIITLIVSCALFAIKNCRLMTSKKIRENHIVMMIITNCFHPNATDANNRLPMDAKLPLWVKIGTLIASLVLNATENCRQLISKKIRENHTVTKITTDCFRLNALDATYQLPMTEKLLQWAKIGILSVSNVVNVE